MSLTLLSSQPNPLDLDEVKRHLRVEDNEDDETIISLMSTAIGIAENYTGIKIQESQWEYKLPCFDQEIPLPIFPVIGIDSISYLDVSGNTQPVASYYLKRTPLKPVLLAAYGETWPSTEAGYEAVTITLTVGYQELPTPIKQALLMIIGSLFENREDEAPIVLHTVPISSRTLLDPYKVILI